MSALWKMLTDNNSTNMQMLKLLNTEIDNSENKNTKSLEGINNNNITIIMDNTDGNKESVRTLSENNGYTVSENKENQNNNIHYRDMKQIKLNQKFTDHRKYIF
jgi:hypothetical protein